MNFLDIDSVREIVTFPHIDSGGDIFTHARTHTYSYTHTHIHPYTFTYTHTHTHTHTHTLKLDILIRMSLGSRVYSPQYTLTYIAISLGELGEIKGQPRNNGTIANSYINRTAMISSFRIMLPPSAPLGEKKLSKIVYNGIFHEISPKNASNI